MKGEGVRTSGGGSPCDQHIYMLATCQPSFPSLLDDLNITLPEERELLLKESRQLCLQELDIVNQALKQKKKSNGNSSESDKSALESMTFDGGAGYDSNMKEQQSTQEKQTQQNWNPREQHNNTDYIRPSGKFNAKSKTALCFQESVFKNQKQELNVCLSCSCAPSLL